MVRSSVPVDRRLCQELHAALKAAGIHQVAAAERLGMGGNRLSRMLSGDLTMPIATAEQVAVLCGLQLRLVAPPMALSELDGQVFSAISREDYQRTHNHNSTDRDQALRAHAEAAMSVVRPVLERMAARVRAAENRPGRPHPPTAQDPGTS